MVFVFWILLMAVIYCYIGYPFLIWILAECFPQRVQRQPAQPSVSIVLAVWNEDDVMESKMQNILALDYPKEKMEVLVASDGSEDDTVKIVEQYSGSELNLKIFAYQDRKGKIVRLNELVAEARHDIVVFMDARQQFDAQAVEALTANFHDRKVGCVSGELVFREADEGTSVGVNVYWKYEKFIRDKESRFHSMLGATGAIYAIRRELFRPVPLEAVLDDMYIPLQIVLKGYRAVFDLNAKAYDAPADNPQEENRRKTRTIFGNYQLLTLLPQAYIPFVSPVAFQMISHKLLRIIMPFFLIGLLIVNGFLVTAPLYRTIFWAQLIFYGSALFGKLARERNYGILNVIFKISYVPYVFCLLNFSAFMGFVKFVMNRQPVTWKKAREKKSG
ncbi:MAG: glycosyltransferase family 2 protein [Candidatus Omnitrophica bacterium]|nr:glycosyltransferase family 2 protein [Candidatus Omnitrophota bacterium]